MNSDGTNQTKITNLKQHSRTSSWSGDGKKIIFTSATNDNKNHADIYEINIDGTNLKQITNTKDEDERTVIYLSDENSIMFDSNTQSGQDSIYTMNLDGTSKVKISTVSGSWGPALSPDKNYFVYSLSGKLLIADKAGKTVKELPVESYDVGSPSWGK